MEVPHAPRGPGRKATCENWTPSCGASFSFRESSFQRFCPYCKQCIGLVLLLARGACLVASPLQSLLCCWESSLFQSPLPIFAWPPSRQLVALYAGPFATVGCIKSSQLTDLCVPGRGTTFFATSGRVLCEGFFTRLYLKRPISERPPLCWSVALSFGRPPAGLAARVATSE